MAYYANDVIAAVDRMARIYYINKQLARGWNDRSRGNDELRLLTGWCWTSKDGKSHAQGLKTQSAAYRDAWYHLVEKRDTPPVARPRLRVDSSPSREVSNAAA